MIYKNFQTVNHLISRAEYKLSLIERLFDLMKSNDWMILPFSEKESYSLLKARIGDLRTDIIEDFYK